MSKKNRITICTRCQFGYPILMIPDFNLEIFTCPACGHKMSFKDWIIGSDEDETKIVKGVD